MAVGRRPGRRCPARHAARLRGGVRRRPTAVLALVGRPRRRRARRRDRAGARGLAVFPQRGDGLGARLAHAHADVPPGASVRADRDGHPAAARPGAAATGAAGARRRTMRCSAPREDGGWWVLGAARPAAAARAARGTDVDARRRTTDTRARARGPRAAGRLGDRALRDVDTAADADAVADVRTRDTEFAGGASRERRGGPDDVFAERAPRPCLRARPGRASPARSGGRWPVADGDLAMLDLCDGPTLDVGCGPGRMTEALSLQRARRARDRRGPGGGRPDRATAGGPPSCATCSTPLPGEGRWHTVLLADGNVGIGGDPVAPAARGCARCSTRGGRVVVELAAPGTGHAPGGPCVWRPRAGRAEPFPWSVVGVDDIGGSRARPGFAATARWTVRRSLVRRARGATA